MFVKVTFVLYMYLFSDSTIFLCTQIENLMIHYYHYADQRWRNPDLPEVIEFLSHRSNAIKANAAAYLQHLCYMDDNIKAKTR